jgi:hypothetical protein
MEGHYRGMGSTWLVEPLVSSGNIQVAYSTTHTRLLADLDPPVLSACTNRYPLIDRVSRRRLAVLLLFRKPRLQHRLSLRARKACKDQKN